MLANGVLQLRGQRQCCWHNPASMRRCGRRTAGKYSLIRNPRVSLDVQVILPSIMFAILIHLSRPFCNAQKMLSILDIWALSEKVSTKYFRCSYFILLTSSANRESVQNSFLNRGGVGQAHRARQVVTIGYTSEGPTIDVQDRANVTT